MNKNISLDDIEKCTIDDSDVYDDFDDFDDGYDDEDPEELDFSHEDNDR